MALSVVKRPQGYVLDTTQITGVTVASSSGALFTKATHGLVTGDFVYIYSTLGSYNGYWYVNKNDANSFRIREYATATDELFINSGGTITYYKSLLTHNWNCVHLPIVYKLKSTIWPTNADDTARSITSFSNYSGYTYINAAGDIKATGTASSLEQVILSGTSVDGIYKIIQWFSDTNFVINLAYSGSNVLSSGTVQYYYFNYAARIRIYAGISSSHYWTAQKPYELVTEQEIIPDSNGIITLNISDFIKSKIEIISNNTLLDTLPNNIDAWCNFYITYAESYDDSNMYTVSEYVSSYTDDSSNFQGYAINAKLPFKTQSQGALSKYVSGLSSNTKQKWLTDFARPTLFAGKYFDISYINEVGSGVVIKRDVYNSSGVLLNVYYDTVSDSGVGIYRQQVSQSASLESRIDLTLMLAAPPTIAAITAWSNYGSGVAWATAVPSVTLPTAFSSSQYLITPFVGIVGVTYTFTITVTISTFNVNSFVIGTLDSVHNPVDIIYIDVASFSTTVSFTPTAPCSYLYIKCQNADDFSSCIYTVNTFTLDSTLSQTLSETISIDVNQRCSFTDFYLVWLNYLGGYNYWNFNAKKGKKYSIDILESKTQDVNIYNNWPSSYGEFADSITKQTKRRSKNKIVVTSQLLTQDQEDALKLIVSSPLVQICTSQYDRRTIILSSNSLYIRQDKDKTMSVSLTVTYTDEIPSQSL